MLQSVSPSSMRRSAADLPLPANPRYQMLDIWRGVACLMIVVLHAAFYFKYDDTPDVRAAAPVAAMIHGIISRFGSGVHLFFVISGYCIAATVDSSRRKPNVGKEFFLRRFRRIFPPYWFALGFTIVLVAMVTLLGAGAMVSDPGIHDTGVLPQPASLSISQWLGNLTLTEHWRHHLFGSPEMKLLGPSWSLCYEEQFYAICGVILLIAPRRFFSGTILVSLFTGLMMLVGAMLGGIAQFDGFFFDGRWLLFAVGVLVYHHVNYGKPRNSWLIPAVLAVTLAALVVVRYRIMREATFEQKSRCFEFIIATTFGVALVALHRWDRLISASPVTAPLAWCGRMCYSLYLIHWPVSKVTAALLFAYGVRGIWTVLLVSVPVCLIASLSTSYLFYLLVECRYMNSSSRKPAAVRESSKPALPPVPQPA
jgi:peptidoglycan/LPS O-acetylase OafA/YrhL